MLPIAPNFNSGFGAVLQAQHLHDEAAAALRRSQGSAQASRQQPRRKTVDSPIAWRPSLASLPQLLQLAIDLQVTGESHEALLGLAEHGQNKRRL